MLLGGKTRIDKTIAGLLQHQMTITSQIVAEIGQQHSTTRAPAMVPKFLRAVARRLSCHVLAKVKKEWEKFVNHLEEITLKQGSTQPEWKVYSSHSEYDCDDACWTCTCLFFTSNHLPCCHLMLVPSQGHGFETLPGMSIPKRWSTFEALDFKDDLASAANALQPIVNLSKLRLPKARIRLPKDDDDSSMSAGRPQTFPSTEKEVVFVWLRRNERANQVVLSSAEKYSYARAMLEPLLQHLSELSSANYNQELSAWKDTVDIGLQRGKSGSSEPENSDDDDAKGPEEDMFSVLDPTEAMGIATLMETRETTEGITDASSEDEIIPATQPTEVGLDDQGQKAGPLADETLPTSGECAPKASSDSVTPTRTHQVDLISVPKPKSQGRTRTKSKQLRQTKLEQRLAVHKYPSNLIVKLSDFVVWMRNSANLKRVAEMIDKYPIQLEDAYLRSRAIRCSWEAMRQGTYMHPFVIPSDLTRSMKAAIKTAKSEQREPDALDDNIKQQRIVLDLVASIDPKLWKFSRQYVGALTTFYEVKRKIQAWFEDRKWLEKDWRKVDADVSLFGLETGTAGLSADAVCSRHWQMSNEIISKFASSRLSSVFATQCGRGLVSFDNVVGGLCRGWLNDSPLEFCLEALVGVDEQCYVLSTLTTAIGWPKPPVTAITATKFFLHHVNLKGNHWGIIIAHFNYDDGKDTLQVNVYLYEPLIDEHYREDVEIEWKGIFDADNKLVKEGVCGFVEKWCQISSPNTKLDIAPIEWVEIPQQPDGASCGVLVVAQAYSYVTGNLQWQNSRVSADDVKVMRLRMLWMILCNSRERRMARATTEAMKTTEAKLLKELK